MSHIRALTLSGQLCGDLLVKPVSYINSNPEHRFPNAWNNFCFARYVRSNRNVGFLCISNMIPLSGVLAGLPGGSFSLVFVTFDRSSGADAFLWRSGRFGASFVFLGFRNIWDVFGCWFSYLTSLLVWRELSFLCFCSTSGIYSEAGAAVGVAVGRVVAADAGCHN